MKNIVNKQIFFWGSRPLGLACFEYLLQEVEKHPELQLTGVCISLRDIQNGKEEGNTISKMATKKNIPVFNETTIKKIKADIGFAIGFPHKIHIDQINEVKNGVVNLHFAPLPYYRGSKTLTHAILNQEKKYGLSLHFIDASLDTGPIISVKWYDLPEKTNYKITTELEKLGFCFFKEYLEIILQNKAKGVSQARIIKNKKITPKLYTRKSIDALYKVSPRDSFNTLYRKVRALQTGSGKLPYMEKGGKKIFLSIRED